jgi:hypothetical protein
LTGNNQISLEIDQMLESLMSLKIMTILDSLKFEITFRDIFNNWKTIGHYIKEKFGLEDSELEDIKHSKLSVPDVSFQIYIS